MIILLIISYTIGYLYMLREWNVAIPEERTKNAFSSSLWPFQLIALAGCFVWSWVCAEFWIWSMARSSKGDNQSE